MERLLLLLVVLCLLPTVVVLLLALLKDLTDAREKTEQPPFALLLQQKGLGVDIPEELLQIWGSKEYAAINLAGPHC